MEDGRVFAINIFIEIADRFLEFLAVLAAVVDDVL
jgi:hypothetical protein